MNIPFFTKRNTQEERSVPMNELDDDALLSIFGIGGPGYTRISRENALTNAVVFACIRVRSETFATMPVHLYRRDKDGTINIDDSDLDSLLHKDPNPYLTPYEWKLIKQQDEDIAGNHYSWIERNSRGRAVCLWPLDPYAMTVKHKDRALIYRYSGDDDIRAQDFSPRDILHFKGAAKKDAYEGKSLVEVTRETIGLGVASEQFFMNLLNNGNHFPRWIETEQGVTKAAIDDLRKQLEGYAGLFSAGATRVFPPGLKVRQMDMSVQEMDLTPQLRWNLEQVARIWRVPLPLVGDMTHGTYTNSEQAAEWLEKYTMSSIVKSTEEVLDKRLAPSATTYWKFNMESLRRGSFKERTEGYGTLIEHGVMTPNEARIKEDMNPLPGLDAPLHSLNYGVVDEQGDIVNPNAVSPVVDDARQRITERYKRDGDTERFRKFAEMVAEPVVATLNNIGQTETIDSFIESCKE